MTRSSRSVVSLGLSGQQIKYRYTFLNEVDTGHVNALHYLLSWLQTANVFCPVHQLMIPQPCKTDKLPAINQKQQWLPDMNAL